MKRSYQLPMLLVWNCRVLAMQVFAQLAPVNCRRELWDQTDGMGVSPNLQKQGYVLLCVAKPLSDLKLETGKEDILYQLQFGKDK
jgi:hypothetical protein